MAPSFLGRRPNYELIPRTSHDTDAFPELESAVSNSSQTSSLADFLPCRVQQFLKGSTYVHYITPRRRKRSVLRLVYWTLVSIPLICLGLVLVAGIFAPSYTNPPAHYEAVKKAVCASKAPGRANLRNEKVFIAASLYESHGQLTSGPWAKSVLELVDLIGPENVYLSVYEDNPSNETRQSLLDLKAQAACNSSIVGEELDLKTLPHVTLPDGSTRLKRIAFLAEVRNRALAPIDTVGTAFDRILFINDVNFNAIDAAQLLFSTNVDASGRANYGAACAVDFINAFKFYDRFATRDLDGHNMGIPFFPWFTSAGTSTSRSYVLAESDAVPVRSCWGGMAAFEAKWFQDRSPLESPPSSNTTVPSSPNPALVPAPLRFRSEEATFWDSSECCLVNADLQFLRTGTGMPADSGIYMNPYIRVAYDPRTLSWLSLTRRPERLYSFIHDALNKAVGFPQNNPRQTEEPGQVYTDAIWKYDDPLSALSSNTTSAQEKEGHWAQVQHVAKPGGFCGGPKLLVINEDPSQGKGKWGSISAPAPAASNKGHKRR